MSTLTSDGREFVYCVFGADGYECDNLEAIFPSQDEAEEYVAELKAGPMWTPLRGEPESADAQFYGKTSLLEVRVVELGKRIDPLAKYPLPDPPAESSQREK
jgi:hypothetical protein